MGVNVWERRDLGLSGNLKSFQGEHNEKVGFLIDSYCNFLEIIDSSKMSQALGLEIIKLPCGIIYDYGWAIAASIFLAADRIKSIFTMTQRVIELVKIHTLTAHISDCSIEFGEIFWLAMQLQGLDVSGFKPSLQLENRLDKLSTMVIKFPKALKEQEEDDLVIVSRTGTK